MGRLEVVGESRLKIPEYANSTEAEFLDIIQTKIVRLFLLAIHSHLYCLEIYISSNSRNLLQFLELSFTL